MPTNDMVTIPFLLGAIAMAGFVAGLVFLRYYRRTRDRFFLFFAASFWLDALGRIWMAARSVSDDGDAAVYTVRILAFALILLAILDKNWPGRR